MKKLMMIAATGLVFVACDGAAIGGDGRTLLEIVQEDRPWESGYDSAYNSATDCDTESDPGFYGRMAKTTSLAQVRRYYEAKGWRTDEKVGHEDVDFLAMKTIFAGSTIMRSGNANRTFFFPRCLVDFS